jgi:hypothetical protein
MISWVGRRYHLSLASHSSAIIGLHSSRKVPLGQPSLTVAVSAWVAHTVCDFAMGLLLNDGDLGQTT